MLRDEGVLCVLVGCTAIFVSYQKLEQQQMSS